MSDWNYLDIWRLIAEVQPESPCISHGARTLTWRDFVREVDRWAQRFVADGVKPGDAVALYLYNCPEYLTAFGGALAAGAVPINVNYRYGVDEVTYLIHNADAAAIVAHGTFVDIIASVRERHEDLRNIYIVDDGLGPYPDWAHDSSQLDVAEHLPLPLPSGDNIFMIYTGGTTGMPKGVMWRCDDMFAISNQGGWTKRYDENGTLAGIEEQLRERGPGYRFIPACPLMHGTGLIGALRSLQEGGHTVLLESRHYDPLEFARVIEEQKINCTAIVGDPFARPLLDVAENEGYHFNDLRLVISAGAMFSAAQKERLLAITPDVTIADAFSSSEALGMGTAVTTARSKPETATFRIGANVRVITDDGRDVIPGSGDVGKVMLGGRLPLGYYKDEAKTAATFPTLDGVRYSCPGDMATVGLDGTLTLLGRGSQCINTGGEKVFPEEVEEVLKRHPFVLDAVVVAAPHERFGQQVVASVELTAGASFDEQELRDWVKTQLAHYKAPRHIRVVPSIGRAPNGKMDYARHIREAVEWVPTS
jgi:fatty-acyl-CoA synthase